MSQLILLRHGQSMWNARNVFTGWVDVPLSQQGIDEAMQAGVELASTPIDCIFTSTLIRAQQTAMLAMAAHDSKKVPIMLSENPDIASKSRIFDDNEVENTVPAFVDWRLNERHYGQLQGLNKAATAEKYGADQVKIWRRSYDVPPPEGESLAMTCKRTLPCLKERIIPALEQGQNCLVSAHGNSLRSLVMFIEALNQAQVLELEIPTGKPRFYRYINGAWQKG